MMYLFDKYYHYNQANKSDKLCIKNGSNKNTARDITANLSLYRSSFIYAKTPENLNTDQLQKISHMLYRDVECEINTTLPQNLFNKGENAFTLEVR